jgi:hypothetical protein
MYQEGRFGRRKAEAPVRMIDEWKAIKQRYDGQGKMGLRQSQETMTISDNCTGTGFIHLRILRNKKK